MKNKHISEGYNIMYLCESRYCFTFEFVMRVKTNCVVETAWLNNTGQMVVHMFTRLPFDRYIFHIYMDKFSSLIPLFLDLHTVGMGACGSESLNSAKYPKEMRFRNDKTRQQLVMYSLGFGWCGIAVSGNFPK
jgi:hypothetical protein